MSNINHPKHYNTNPSGIEAIEVCEHCSFNLGNAFKYLYRRHDKGRMIEDMEKALWYVKREQARRARMVQINATPEIWEKAVKIAKYENYNISEAIQCIMRTECFAAPGELFVAIEHIQKEIDLAKERMSIGEKS